MLAGGLKNLRSLDVAFFIFASFRFSRGVTPEQMAKFEVAVMYAMGWTDDKDSLSVGT